MKKSLSRRITAYFLIIMVLMIIISVTWNYLSTRRSIIEMEKRQAEGCAGAIETLLQHDGNDLDDVIDSSGHQFLWNAVANFCMGFDQDSIYIYTLDPGADKPRMLLHVTLNRDTATPVNDAKVFHPLLTSKPGEPEAVPVAGSENLWRTEWGKGLDKKAVWTALLDIPESDKPIYLGMEYSIGLENDYILHDFLSDILMPNFALGIAFFVMLRMIHKRVVLPIGLISDRMKRFARNIRVRPEPLNVHSDDEIGEIAESFETMTKDITASIDNLEKLTKERVELHVQMDVARRIQYGLVPKTTVLDGEACHVRAMTRPARAVGGDFYDCFKMDNGTVCVFMGDVSGKGITAAIFMAVIKTMLREKLMLGLSPAQALNRTNEQLIAQNPEGLFATAFIAILDPSTGALRYANAGHTWPVLLGDGPRFLKPDTGIALGLFEDADIRDETMTLSPGQGIFLYTDGLPDALNPARASFGLDRILETLKDIPEEQDPAEGILMKVSRDVDAYCEGADQFDDMALLALCLTGAPPAAVLDPLPVKLASFARIKETILARTGDTPAARRALLACDETLANIVEYSGASHLAFQCEKRGDTLEVTFSDNGTAFDPTCPSDEEKPFEMLDSGGMGLNLIMQTADSARYAREKGMNVLSLTFSL